MISLLLALTAASIGLAMNVGVAGLTTNGATNGCRSLVRNSLRLLSIWQCLHIRQSGVLSNASGRCS
jgi:hypothetical protein